MASRKRYRLDQVAVEPGEVRRAKWTFAKGGRQAPVRGNRAPLHGDRRQSRRPEQVGVPGAGAGRRRTDGWRSGPDDTADPHLEGADLPLAPIPEGHQGRARGKRYCQGVARRSAQPDARRTIPAGTAPRTSSGATSAAIFPSGSRASRAGCGPRSGSAAPEGTDGNTLVILVNPDDHAMMIRLYFAMKVWVLKEGIELQ